MIGPMYSKNNTDPSMEPCGTPELMSSSYDLLMLKGTDRFLYEKLE